MKKVLILYSHWPPSNLAGVHRARLISNFLPEFGWEPWVLTVEEEYYEEKPDPDLVKTVADTTTVVKVPAKAIRSKKRIVGDITLRAWSNLLAKAKELIKLESFDFLWVPIPSFYSAILARRIHDQSGIPYGIDYIDPWVDSFVGQEQLFSKAWISNQIARIMEPYAVKKASLISGVSTPYYQGVLDRNFRDRRIKHVGMPYGFDPSDHQVDLGDLKTPWKEDEEVYVYAGAFLPKSHFFLNQLFSSVQELKETSNWPSNRKLYFLGTGIYPGKQIREYANEYGISEFVTEITDRFPFLHILNFLGRAKGVMVIGSTEAHYTASKVFQSLLSGRPVLGMFHQDSSATEILKECKADQYLIEYDPEDENKLLESVKQLSPAYFDTKKSWNPDLKQLDRYSAKESARKLVEQLELIVHG